MTLRNIMFILGKACHICVFKWLYRAKHKTQVTYEGLLPVQSAYYCPILSYIYEGVFQQYECADDISNCYLQQTTIPFVVSLEGGREGRGRGSGRRGEGRGVPLVILAIE